LFSLSSDAPSLEQDTLDDAAGFLFSLMESLHAYTPPEAKEILPQLSDPNKKGSFYYWLVWVTHCLEKLHGNNHPDHSFAAAWLSYHAVVKLVAFLPKLEKLHSSRQVGGKFLLVMTLMATSALHAMAQEEEDSESSADPALRRASIKACIVAIDAATMLHHSTTTVEEDMQQQVWEGLKNSIILGLEEKWIHERDRFRRLLLFQGEDVWTETEKTYWQALVEMDATQQPERIKRKRRNPVKTQQSHDMDLLLGQLSTATVDLRLAIRRWSAVGLVFCSGQMAILESSLCLLRKNHPEESASRTIALVCRLCHIVWEAGNSAGLRPPGGLEAYMKNPKEKPAKIDLKDIATVLSYELIRKHHEDCLQQIQMTPELLWHGQPEDASQDRTSIKRVMPDGYYPFLHEAIHDLANAAAASIATFSADQQKKIIDRIEFSAEQQKNIIDRIEFAAAAYIIQYQSRIWPSPLDVRLAKFSISKLKSCLSPESNQSADVAGSSCPPQEINTSQQSVTETIPWDQPLPIPAIRVTKQKSRKRKATADNNLDYSFAGIYHASARVELSCDGKFSLFARAMIQHNKTHTRRELFSLLSSHLIAVLERCYDTRDVSVVLDNTLLPREERKRKPNKTSSQHSKRRKSGGERAQLHDMSGDSAKSSVFR
jgi:hypothetical protein